MIYRIILQKETILGFNEEEWIDNNDLRRISPKKIFFCS